MVEQDIHFDIINALLLNDENYLSFSSASKKSIMDYLISKFTKKKKRFQDDIKIILSSKKTDNMTFKEINEYLNNKFINSQTNEGQKGGVKGGHEGVIIFYNNKLYKKIDVRPTRVYEYDQINTETTLDGGDSTQIISEIQKGSTINNATKLPIKLRMELTKMGINPTDLIENKLNNAQKNNVDKILNNYELDKNNGSYYAVKKKEDGQAETAPTPAPRPPPRPPSRPATGTETAPRPPPVPAPRLLKTKAAEEGGEETEAAAKAAAAAEAAEAAKREEVNQNLIATIKYFDAELLFYQKLFEINTTYNTKSQQFEFLSKFYKITTLPLLDTNTDVKDTNTNVKSKKIKDKPGIYYPIGNLRKKKENDSEDNWSEIVDYKIGLYSKNNYDASLSKEKDSKTLISKVFDQLRLDTISTSYQNGFRMEGNGDIELNKYEKKDYKDKLKLDPMLINKDIINTDMNNLYKKFNFTNQEHHCVLLHLLHNNPFLTHDNSIKVFLLARLIKNEEEFKKYKNMFKQSIFKSIQKKKNEPIKIPKKENRFLYSIPVMLSINKLIDVLSEKNRLSKYKEELYNLYECFIDTHKFEKLSTNPICGFIGSSIMISYNNNNARIRLSDFGHPYFIYEDDSNKQVIEKQIYINFVLGIYKFIFYNALLINVKEDEKNTECLRDININDEDKTISISISKLLENISNILETYPNIYPEYSTKKLSNYEIRDKFSYYDINKGRKHAIGFYFDLSENVLRIENNELYKMMFKENVVDNTETEQEKNEKVKKHKNAINRLIYLQKQNILLNNLAQTEALKN